IAGIEGVVAQKFKYIAVNLVGSRFSDDVDHASNGISVDGAHIACDEIEFLERVGIRERYVGIDVRVVGIDAIQEVIDSVRATAVDLGVLLAGKNAALTVGSAIAGGHVDRSRRKKDQLLYVAAVQW